MQKNSEERSFPLTNVNKYSPEVGKSGSPKDALR